MRRRGLSQPSDWTRGVGLFSASACAIRFLPGLAGQGLRVRRGADTLGATIEHVTPKGSLCGLPEGIPPRNTTLAIGDRPLARTIEHAMAALAGLGVTDAVIELEGDEVPILDGSAIAFVEALRPLLMDLPGMIEPFKPSRVVEVGEGASRIVITPREAPGARYEFRLAYPAGTGIGPQAAAWDGTPDLFERAIAPARTFCLESEAMAMRRAGLFAHLTAREMLVIGPDGSAMDNTLRYPDEPARHKLLDLIGDLALLGRPLQADVVAERSGHALTHAAVRALLARG